MRALRCAGGFSMLEARRSRCFVPGASTLTDRPPLLEEEHGNG
jgi:hypothetical protein